MTHTSYPLHKIKVLLLEGVHPTAAELMEEAGYTVELHKDSLSEPELIDIAADAHMIGIRSKTNLTRNFFDHSKHLWAVGCFCIGTNQVDLEAATQHGVTVFNAPFSNTRSVAEKTICETIALQRRLFERSMAMHQGRWTKSASGAHEVRSLTMGIVGYGRIGSQVSILAEALGMRVLYYDTVNRLPLGNAQQVRSLDALLEQADILTLHVPATATTNNLINARAIARMKHGAILINNARGSVVDIDALAAALKEGKLAGAAIDVFPEEPKDNDAPFENPLRQFPNVILTPHIGGSTIEAQKNIGEEVATKLIKHMNNGSTTFAVNIPEVELPVLHEKHHRILHFHHNVPGVLSKMHRIIADLGVNIVAEHLQSNPRYSYVIMDVAPEGSEALKDRLKSEVEETIRVRSIW